MQAHWSHRVAAAWVDNHIDRQFAGFALQLSSREDRATARIAEVQWQQDRYHLARRRVQTSQLQGRNAQGNKCKRVVLVEAAPFSRCHGSSAAVEPFYLA